MRRILTALPAKAQDPETALHAACDSGHWEGEVRAIFVKDIDSYRDILQLELVTEDSE